MALFKPKGAMSDGGGNKFMGVCEMAVISFEDKSADFDWADIFIVATVAIKDSEYNRDIKIRGSFDKDAKGNITGGSVLNRMYKFFGDIGCSAGVNVKGEWETEDGTKIKDIAKYLNDNHAMTVLPGAEPDLTHVGYVYKEENKKTGKAYNTVHYRLFPNNSNGKVDLASHVKWMKTNGYLKEATVTATRPTQQTALPETVEDAL
tara:strand:- start:3013 stop:3627 length:615 start_codon:yes stop_codon:yes gene_type:complete